MGTKDGAVKKVAYITPRRGGVFVMPDDLIAQQEMMQQFFMVKPLSTIILSNVKHFKICPMACQQELFYIRQTQAHLDTLPELGNGRKSAFFQYYSKMFVNCTLMRHPCGRHIDVFANGMPSLENRICLSCPLDNKEKNASGTERYGRGGAGTERYTFALLDW